MSKLYADNRVIATTGPIFMNGRYIVTPVEMWKLIQEYPHDFLHHARQIDTKCEYCDSWIDVAAAKCPNCSAPNRNRMTEHTQHAYFFNGFPIEIVSDHDKYELEKRMILEAINGPQKEIAERANRG